MKHPLERKQVTIRLSPAQAKLVWGFVDGALDAGACEGGITAKERAALLRTSEQLLAQTVGTTINSDDVDLPEAAADLLRAFDSDYRTVPYKHDLWERLRACLNAEGRSNA